VIERRSAFDVFVTETVRVDTSDPIRAAATTFFMS
jgi:hypothetical protein